MLNWRMKAEKSEKNSHFRRKVYTQMYNSSISQIQADCKKAQKKIIPTNKKLGMREEFKKVFLPLLIDVFELRQMIRNHDSQEKTNAFIPLQKPPHLSREKILNKLEELQEEIAESKRWVEGVITQIDKAVAEAKESLTPAASTAPPPPKPLCELSQLLNTKDSNEGFLFRLFKRKRKP